MDTIEYYNNNAEIFINSTFKLDMTETQNIFLSYLTKNGKILDFGCGSGRDTKKFIEKGYEVEAIDGSKEICEIVSKKLNIEIKNIDFFELNQESEYDGIWACASLLHIEQKRLPEIFDILYKALKKGGILYTSFKKGDETYIENGKLYTNMNKEKMHEILKDTKYNILKEWESGDKQNRNDTIWYNIIISK